MPGMKASEAFKFLNEAAHQPEKIKAFDELAKQLGVPRPTVYSWWYNENIPHWRLAAFDKLKRRAAR